MPNPIYSVSECPFCHTDHPMVFDMDDEHWVACRHCNAIGPSAPSAAQAIELWNQANPYLVIDNSGISVSI